MSWPVVSLGSVATFLSGFAFKSEKFNSDGRGLPIVRIRDVVRGQSNTFFDGDFDPRYLVEDGDYLIGMDGEFNLAPWRGGQALLNQRVCKLDTLRSDVDRAYVAKFLPMALKRIEDSTPFVTVKHLSVKKLNEVALPLPPLEEQRRIAAILDQAEELRAQRRAAIALLDQLPQAIFLEMFGDRLQIFENWPTMPLGSVLSFLTSGSRGWAKHYAASGAHFLRIQNVRRDELDLCDVAFVRPPSTKEAKRTRVEAGDVLLSITADLGRTAVVDDRISAGYINQHLAILRPAPMLDSQFLSSFIASDAGQVQIQNKNRHGVKAGLNFDDIKTIATPLPPYELQRDFATRVQTSRQVKSVFQAALTELDALFDSLQSHVFGGQHA